MPRVREGVMSVTVEAAQMSPKRLRTDPAQNLESKEEDARGMADPREEHWWTLGGGGGVGILAVSAAWGRRASCSPHPILPLLISYLQIPAKEGVDRVSP